MDEVVFLPQGKWWIWWLRYSWDISAGTTSLDSSGYLSRMNRHILVSLFLAVFTLPTTRPVHKTSVSPSNAPLVLPQGLQKCSYLNASLLITPTECETSDSWFPPSPCCPAPAGSRQTWTNTHISKKAGMFSLELSRFCLQKAYQAAAPPLKLLKDWTYRVFMTHSQGAVCDFSFPRGYTRMVCSLNLNF